MVGDRVAVSPQLVSACCQRSSASRSMDMERVAGWEAQGVVPAADGSPKRSLQPSRANSKNHSRLTGRVGAEDKQQGERE